MRDVANWNVPIPLLNKQATLHDVARAAGVSKSTVSLVLQGRSSVSAKTRDQVLAAIESTGYVYNRKAAALRQAQRNDLIGVIVNELNTPYSGEVLSQIEKVCFQQNLVLMFASSSDLCEKQERLVQLYMEHKVGGFILCPAPYTDRTWLERIWSSGFPLVQIMREVSFSQLPVVIADNRQGAYEAVKHLIQLGHQKIAFVGGSEEISDYQERLAGYMTALNEAGIRVPAQYICPIPQSRQAGRDGLKTVLAYDSRISAVFCFSDLVAYGVFSMAREMGIQIGKDLAVVGFDDLEDSHITHPALTTVRVEANQYAIEAMNLLRVYQHDRQAPVVRRVVPARLIIRESCGAPQQFV
ncbi:LacI family DNA-binding transcriptional regulator [Thiolinea disciformis]|uniref:LacI family DNA-binding transcriptional regulator n=1 Tax=Thiolinea disciformis TaxID=125614 RepID=UPI000365FD16|nr:LacI family DNA-binding transcriptional regulator [Thiolinea disciformis]